MPSLLKGKSENEKVWLQLDTNGVEKIKAINREDKLACLVMFDVVTQMIKFNGTSNFRCYYFLLK